MGFIDKNSVKDFAKILKKIAIKILFLKSKVDCFDLKDKIGALESKSLLKNFKISELSKNKT